jgi:hypothetical protein
MFSCQSFVQLSHDLAGWVGFVGAESINWDNVLRHPEVVVPVGMMILGAIGIVGAVVVKVVRTLVIYRERIYRIEHGLDPDIPPETNSTRRRV